MNGAEHSRRSILPNKPPHHRQRLLAELEAENEIIEEQNSLEPVDFQFVDLIGSSVKYPPFEIVEQLVQEIDPSMLNEAMKRMNFQLGEKSRAVLTLNRPKQLNALSDAMVSRLLELFLAFEEDPSVKLIILKGKGRAFCSGGDVAAVVREINQGNWKSGANYFRKEFTMNYVIATYSKAQVSILNGIVMGGGAASVVGQRLPLLEEALIKANSGAPEVISSIIGRFSQMPSLKKNIAYHRLDIINKCFSPRTVEEIIVALAAEKKDDWISSTIQSLKTSSPTSLKISLRSIREGRLQGIGKCLVREFRMVCHMMRGDISKDFVEGCRAILFDKDKNPKWEPSKLESISGEMVECYFSKVKDDDDWEDLKLPVRPNLATYGIAKL
ncbi:hypothetical protein ACS0TY_003635 [Phlomoides rotata]